MKSIAVLAGVACIFIGTSFTSAASFTKTQTRAHPPAYTTMVFPAIGPLKMRRVLVPLQSAVTPTPTATAGTAVTPTATPNPAYPDPVTLLNNSFSLYGELNGVHFTDVTAGTQQSTVNLHISAVGDAVCKGPSLKAKVTSKETISSQSQSKNFNLINVKNAYYIKAKSTKNKWAKVKASQASAFSFSIDNPLSCPTSSSAASGTGASGLNSQIKDLTNLGPESVASVPVWHIQATEVDVDPTTGDTTQALLDYYIGQQHPFPYKYQATVNDAQNGIQLIFTQTLAKFGEKVTIKAPTVGSTTP